MGVVAALPDYSQYLAEVLVATTWRCNLRCSYCFVREQSVADTQDRMSESIAVNVIDALDRGLADVEHICVHFYGGEPLTHLPAMEAMVARAREKARGRFLFSLTTNGTVLTDRVLRLLRRGRFEVVLSIDGPTAVHDQYRRTGEGEPTHDSVMAFLRAVRSKTSCWVRGSSVVRGGWSLAQANGYLRTLPVDVIKAQAVRGAEGTPFALSSTEKRAYLDDLEAVGRDVIAELEAGKRPVDDRYSNRVLQLLKGERRTSFCGAGCTVFGVHPCGEVLPCVLMQREGNVLGHVNEDPQSWVKAGRRWRKSRRLRERCRKCDAVDLCGGGCPIMMPLCGPEECDLIRKNCDVARRVFNHFRSDPERLLLLAGIS